MAKPSTKGLLKEILSDDIESVYINITNKAVEWAISGFIDKANQLLEQIWEFKIPHSGNVWLLDEGLQIMWKISKKYPANTPFKFKEISEIESENWSRNFYPIWHNLYTDSLKNKTIDELTGQQLFVKAIMAALIKVDEQLVDIWANSMDEVDPYFGEKLRSSLIIGGHGEEQQLLLVPLKNNNWECWHFSSWRPGQVVYQSFRFYMEGELQNLEDRLHVD